MATQNGDVVTPRRAITISYAIAVPSDANSGRTLDPKRTVQIPVTDLTSLSGALDEARNETNSTLTQWKDEIGELEKPKEARVAKEAEERRRAKKMAAVAAGVEDEAESDEEEENEQ